MTETATANPEIGTTVDAAGIGTNLHDQGSGAPVLLIHGSGPGVSAWANWRGVIPELAATRRVVAPDIVGFGYTERPTGFSFTRQNWVDHLVGVLDALELDRVSIVGNSFGGALAMWLAQVDPSRLLQPKIEAEVAFVLGADLDGPLDDEALTASVSEVVPALEIVDSRVSGWDISFADTVADNASSGLYALGSTRLRSGEFGDDLREGLAALSMRMLLLAAGGEQEQVSTGTGRDCLSSPLAALRWLAATAARHGEPLRAGQVVLSGALGPMVPVAPGDEFRAEIVGLGDVTVRFASLQEDS